MLRFAFHMVITMGSLFFFIGSLLDYLLGKVTLINNTGEDIEIREHRVDPDGPRVVFEHDNFFDVIHVKDGKSVKVNAEKYRLTSYSCEFSLLTASCGGCYLEMEPLDAQDLIASKTITFTKEQISQDPISTEAIKYRFVVTKELLQL